VIQSDPAMSAMTIPAITISNQWPRGKIALKRARPKDQTLANATACQQMPPIEARSIFFVRTPERRFWKRKIAPKTIQPIKTTPSGSK
jgi:hypothetical protein